MSWYGVAGTVWLGFVATAGLLMAFARTGPEEAASNLSKWVERTGVWHAPRWLKNKSADRIVRRWAFGMLVVLLLLGVAGMASYFWNAPDAESVAPTSPPITREQASIQMSGWADLPGGYISPLINSINRLDLLLSTWQVAVRKDRAELVGNLRQNRDEMAGALSRIEEFRQANTSVPGLSNAVARPSTLKIITAIDAFTDALRELPAPLPSDIDTPMRPLYGVLRGELQVAATWATSLTRTSGTKVHELSETLAR